MQANADSALHLIDWLTGTFSTEAVASRTHVLPRRLSLAECIFREVLEAVGAKRKFFDVV
jgi:hypothetical protein